MNGLLSDYFTPEDRQQALYAGLTNMGAGLLMGGGVSMQPGGDARGLAQGLAGFNQGYQGSQNALMSRAMMGMQLQELQRKQAAQKALAEATQGNPAPIQPSDPNQPGALSMADRMNMGGQGAANYQSAMQDPKAQAAIMELYGPAGVAALRKEITPIAVNADQGLYIPGQGFVKQPGAKQGELPWWAEVGPDGKTVGPRPGAMGTLGMSEDEQARRRLIPVQPGGSVVSGAALLGNSPGAPGVQNASPGSQPGLQPTGQGVVTVPNNPNTAETPFLKELGGLGAKQVYDDASTAESVVKSQRMLNEAKTLLGKGMITGTGANFRTSFGNALATAGLTNGEDVANTQAFVSAMGSQTMTLVKNLGSGTGISNSDRDFAEKVAGGNIELTEPAIRRIMDINERANKAFMDRYNKNVAPLLADDNVPAYVKGKLSMQLPQMTQAPTAPPTPTFRYNPKTGKIEPQ